MTDSPAEAPAFDPFAFPPALVAAQREAAEVEAELRRFQATLPWSREPQDGWEAPEQVGGMSGYRSSRPPSPGWTDEQKAEYDRLWELRRKTTLAVYAHEHWKACGAKAVEARQALKRVPEAQPVVKAEIPDRVQEDAALELAAG
ncbi:hypothetical protein [Streptomyces coeruleorubidus]|uniref:hypothetical protein n=1 Tax=Streptomyces coeruleorubidus TaxID=116188 RepID=UPI0033AD8597